MIADVLAKLLRGSFRDVEFFASGFSFGFEQTHVQHLYPDRDAGFVEATGRNPATHSFQAIFRNGNGLATSLQYPGAWRSFVTACLDRSMGTLLHPELGPLKVKCRSLRTSWDATKRDGVDVEVEFVETTDKEDELAAIFSRDAGYAVEFEAGFLDAAIKDVTPAPKADATLSPSLLDSVKQLTGTIAQAKASVGNVAAAVESYANAIDDLAQQIDSLNEPAYAPILESMRALHAGVLDLGASVKTKLRPVTLVVVARDAPTSAVASAFGNSLEDFLSLNPALGSKTSLPSGEPVFVYAV